MTSKIDKGKKPSVAGESPIVDPTIWKAIAGTSPDFPPTGSKVHYFFDGHAEQCSFPPDLCPFGFECLLAAVNLHADPATEQLFAVFTLSTDESSPTTSNTFPSGGRSVTSVAITLAKSETNCGKETLFLKLPESADGVFRNLRPGDDVDVYDLNNEQWTFRHVLSGSPPRHTLTDGWRDFVSCKLLVAGDAVIFVRDDDGIIFVGLRRRDDENIESGTSTNKLLPKKEEPEVVTEAAQWAEEDGEGTVQVRYYPDSKLPVYVVRKEVMEDAMRVPWKRGLRVTKKREMDDGTINWLLGTVISISPDIEFTQWRMLEVIWETYRKTFENPWDLQPLLT